MAIMLPRQRTWGEALAEGLGTGISTGSQALAKMKLDQMLSGPANIASLKMAGLAAGMSPDEIDRIAGIGGGFIGSGKGGIRPQEIIKIGQKKQELDLAKQKAINNKLAPDFKKLREDVSLTEKILPNLRSLARLIETGKVGGGLFGSGWFQGSEGQEYQSIIDELEAMKIKGIPKASDNITTQKNRINNLIKRYEKKLKYKDIVNDILEEHDNNTPPNIFKLADQRMNLRDEQYSQRSTAKNLAEREPGKTFPFSENEAQSNILSGSPQIDPYAEGMVPHYSPEQLERMLPGDTQREITQSPMGLDALLGILGRTGGRGLAGLLGGTGQTLSVVPDITSAVSSGKTPTYEELRGKAPYVLPPKTKEIKERFEAATEPGILSPQFGIERILGPAAEEFGEMIAPGNFLKPIVKGAQLIGKVPKFLQSAQNFLNIAPKAAASITAAGNAAKVALEEAGAPESVQEVGKLAASLGTSMGSVFMARRGAATAEKAITKGLSKFPASVRADWNAYRRFGEELSNPKLSTVNRNDIEPIFIALQKSLTKKLNGTPLSNIFNDYKDLLKGASVSSKIHNLMKKNLMTFRGQIGINSLLRMLGTSKASLLSKYGMPIVAGGVVLGELEKGVKLMNLNPTFRRKYGDLFKAGILAATQLGARKTI